MRGQKVGSLIGAVFGLIYVMVNAGPLPASLTVALRALGVVAFLAVLAALVLRHRGVDHPTAVSGESDAGQFGRSFWTVVLIEVVALFGGLAVVNGVLDRSDAGVAWVSTVVGVHFFGLARVFALRFFTVLGVAITACGVVGLILAAAGSEPPPIAAVSGVLPGFILLGVGWWGATVGPTSRAPQITGLSARSSD